MNYAPMPFIQPDNPFMLLEKFALPPTIVQSAIPKTTHSGKQLRVEGSNLTDALKHYVPHIAK